MTTLDLTTLRAMPAGALVPVEWVRQLVAGLGDLGSDDGLGDTVGRVAELTNRAPSTIRTWCNEGRLHGARRLRGREWRIPRASLRALLEGDEPSRGGGAKRLDVPRGGLGAWRNS